MKLTARTAAKYATAVVDTLVNVGELDGLTEPTTADIVRDAVTNQLQAPSAAFECIVDDPCVAIWRLRARPGVALRLACTRLTPTAAEQAREDRVNAALNRLAAQYTRRTWALR